jgi:hypothetical protein
MEFFQAKLVLKDPQARRLSNPEVATKHHTRNEWLFCKHRANGPRKIICQGRSEPEIAKKISSPLMKVYPLLLHCQ